MGRHLQWERTCKLMTALLLCQSLLIGNLQAEEGTEIIKIASKEHAVLVKSAEGRLKVIHTGDLFAPYGRIASISNNRIVLKNRNAETVILRLKNNKTHVQRIQKTDTSASKSFIQITSNSDVKNNMGRRSSNAAEIQKPENNESR